MELRNRGSLPVTKRTRMPIWETKPVHVAGVDQGFTLLVDTTEEKIENDAVPM